MRGLEGEVALVTGATGLIGGAVARRLAEEGAQVLVASRERERAEAWIAAAPGALRARLRPVALDLRDAAGIPAAMAAAGPVTVLVAAASDRNALLGTPPAGPTAAQFAALFAADVAGHHACASALVEGLPAGRGASIVWLSSIYALVGPDPSVYPPGMAPSPVHYGAVKSAVGGLVANLAAAWGPLGVRVNALVAGGVRAEGRQPAPFVEAYARRTMLGRMASAEDVAAAAAFLASADAAYITGTALVVDGGLTAW